MSLIQLIKSNNFQEQSYFLCQRFTRNNRTHSHRQPMDYAILETEWRIKIGYRHIVYQTTFLYMAFSLRLINKYLSRPVTRLGPRMEVNRSVRHRWSAHDRLIRPIFTVTDSRITYAMPLSYRLMLVIIVCYLHCCEMCENVEKNSKRVQLTWPTTQALLQACVSRQ